MKDETTLLIKLPPELKASFQGLCKFRGVSVSAELRRFMADEVSNTAHGMTTDSKKASNSLSKVNKLPKHQKAVNKPQNAKLDLETAFRKALKP